MRVRRVRRVRFVPELYPIFGFHHHPPPPYSTHTNFFLVKHRTRTRSGEGQVRVRFGRELHNIFVFHHHHTNFFLGFLGDLTNQMDLGWVGMT